MIGGILDTTSFFSGGIGDTLNNLAQAGFFSYVLPFLLIFALVFGILTRMGLFKENKAVTAIIALAVGLMAITQPIVPQFFSQIFPNLGIGLSIILVILILIGLFTDPTKPGLMYTLLGISALVAIVVIAQSSGTTGSNIWQWIQDNIGSSLGTILILVFAVIVVAAVINHGKPKKEPGAYQPYGFLPVGKP